MDLDELAGRFGEPLTAETSLRLERYLELLLEWNRAINLTGANGRADLVAEHLPDAFALCRLVGPADTLVDVGSGGGLPGIPFALLRPAVQVTLSEPRAKRRAFLTQVVHQLKLHASVTPSRAEELPPARFAVAVARAVYAPDRWLEVGARLLAPGGRLVVLLPADSDWRPSGEARVVDEVRYSAGPRPRLAVAVAVPRGT